MDFVTHLPRTSRGHNEVWVIVDQFTKSAHFLVVWMTSLWRNYVGCTYERLFDCMGYPVSIVLDKDPGLRLIFLSVSS